MLRLLELEDLELIFVWRNDPSVRQVMHSQHEITWNEHLRWFQLMKLDESKVWYLYIDKYNQPAGVVYFTNWDPVQGNAFWGFYANPDAPRGTGLKMSYDALECAFNKMSIKKLNAEVLAYNLRSLEFHKKVGFFEEGCFCEQHFNSVCRTDIIRFGMLKKDWLKKKLYLQKLIT